MSAEDPVRAYLDSVLESRMEIKRLRRKIEALEARATNITSQLTGMPRGGSSDRDSVLVSLADILAEYCRKLAEAERAELGVYDFIDSLAERDHRIILRLRYIEGKRWPRVLNALKNAGLNMSDRQMYRLHGEALSAARDKWKETHTYDES